MKFSKPWLDMEIDKFTSHLPMIDVTNHADHVTFDLCNETVTATKKQLFYINSGLKAGENDRNVNPIIFPWNDSYNDYMLGWDIARGNKKIEGYTPTQPDPVYVAFQNLVNEVSEIPAEILDFFEQGG